MDVTEQPEPSNPAEPTDLPDIPARAPGRARLALRVSMISMALAMVAFAYFAPVWMDRGLTKANGNRLSSIAEKTAQMILVNDWNVEQGIEYAQRQTKLGNVDTVVDITIGDTAVTVRITGTAASANPFASLTGADAVNRIEVTHTKQK